MTLRGAIKLKERYSLQPKNNLHSFGQVVKYLPKIFIRKVAKIFAQIIYLPIKIMPDRTYDYEEDIKGKSGLEISKMIEAWRDDDDQMGGAAFDLLNAIDKWLILENRGRSKDE